MVEKIHQTIQFVACAYTAFIQNRNAFCTIANWTKIRMKWNLCTHKQIEKPDSVSAATESDEKIYKKNATQNQHMRWLKIEWVSLQFPVHVLFVFCSSNRLKCFRISFFVHSFWCRCFFLCRIFVGRVLYPIEASSESKKKLRFKCKFCQCDRFRWRSLMFTCALNSIVRWSWSWCDNVFNINVYMEINEKKNVLWLRTL